MFYLHNHVVTVVKESVHQEDHEEEGGEVSRPPKHSEDGRAPVERHYEQREPRTMRVSRRETLVAVKLPVSTARNSLASRVTGGCFSRFEVERSSNC